MVPYLAQRALTVIRCPDGIGSQCFFQKNVTPSVPRSVSKVRVRGADEKTVVYPVVDTAEGLLAMVQNGAVEFHVWGSQGGGDRDARHPRLRPRPRPGPAVAPRARGRARAARGAGRAAGWRATSGRRAARGSTWSCRTRSRARWPRVGAFAREVVETLVAREPDKYTATMSKAKRGGKVFVDHFRNGRGATSVTSYSLRARAGAPVALPIGWDELGRTQRGRRLDGRAGAAPPEDARGRSRGPDFFETGRRQKLPGAGR